MKSFSINPSFGVHFKLKVPPLLYKINAHNISGFNTDSRVVMTNFVYACDQISNEFTWHYIYITFTLHLHVRWAQNWPLFSLSVNALRREIFLLKICSLEPICLLKEVIGYIVYIAREGIFLLSHISTLQLAVKSIDLTKECARKN